MLQQNVSQSVAKYSTDGQKHYYTFQYKNLSKPLYSICRWNIRYFYIYLYIIVPINIIYLFNISILNKVYSKNFPLLLVIHSHTNSIYQSKGLRIRLLISSYLIEQNSLSASAMVCGPYICDLDATRPSLLICSVNQHCLHN